ncbi:MAG: HemK/PrmC family methyltransferase [Acidimicrobiales bacterium]
MAADEEAAELVAAAADHDQLDRMVARRREGEPLAWITGTAQFCGLDVAVRPGVYVPRWQSETLAATAARLLAARGTAVDLCTGSGAIAMVLQAARPGARVVATELDPTAADCARDNGVDVLVGDLDEPLPADLAGRVDVMTGVPPYVPDDALHLLPRDVRGFEPRRALDGGRGGLEVVARMITCSTRWMATGGRLLVEIGGRQFDPVARLLTAAGFDSVEVLHDGDGDPRAVCGRFADPTATPRPAQASSR